MDKKKITAYNLMLDTLKRIAKYDSPERLKKNSWDDRGCNPAEAIEMAYENIQAEAKEVIK